MSGDEASEAAIDDLTRLLPALLLSLDALAHFARHFDPMRFDESLAAIGAPEDELRAAFQALRTWPAHLSDLRGRIEAATAATLEGYELLRGAPDEPEGLRAVMRALKRIPRALDPLYPLTRGLPPVSRFFLDEASRGNAEIEARLAAPPRGTGTGVSHVGDSPGARGGFSIYVPEFYEPAQSWPLVFALHGGGGDGFSFLWSWLPTARAQGAIVVAPTAIGRTWALMGEDVDTPNLLRILDFVRGRLNVDSARLLLTGMSDGGTFCYVSGLEAASPFTHLAPVSASFHPMLASMADETRLAGLPILIAHGARDWMFHVNMAREAQAALTRVGANVTYREIADLAHAFPREICADILAWTKETERAGGET